MIDYLGNESRIRLPNVDEVLDIGYAFHAADDPALNGHSDQALALKITQDFISLEPQPNTTEVPYISCIKGIALSFGRSISRRKDKFIVAIQTAQEERLRQIQKLRGSVLTSSTVSALWKVIGWLVIGLVVYLIAYILGPHVISPNVGEQTGKTIPSILASLIIAFMLRMFQIWRIHRVDDRITAEYNAACYLAFLDYEKGKLRDYGYFRERLLEAWLQYTGEPYPDTPSYQLISKGDIESRKILERHTLISNMSDVRKVLRLLRIYRQNRKNGKNNHLRQE